MIVRKACTVQHWHQSTKILLRVQNLLKSISAKYRNFREKLNSRSLPHVVGSQQVTLQASEGHVAQTLNTELT